MVRSVLQCFGEVRARPLVIHMRLRSGLPDKRFSSLQIQESTYEDDKNNDNDRELRNQVGMA